MARDRPGSSPGVARESVMFYVSMSFPDIDMTYCQFIVITLCQIVCCGADPILGWLADDVGRAAKA